MNKLNDTSININLVKGVQLIGRVIDNQGVVKNGGVQTYVGTIQMKDLIGNFEVPIFDSVSGDGYQRQPKDARLKAVKDRITINPDDPTIFADSINLNLRYDPDNHTLMKLLNPLDPKNKGVGSFWTFAYDSSVLKEKFQIVDGQTRVVGTESAITEAKQFSRQVLVNKLLDISVNFSLTFTQNKLEEAYQFYLINTHSASIPAEGAHRLLYDAYKSNDQNFAIEINKNEKVQMEMDWGEVTEKLLNSSSVWSSKIRNYNETIGVSGKRKTVTIRAMSKNLVSSVYEELRDSYPKGSNVKLDQLTFEVIDAFWKGLKAVYPGCEDTNSNIMQSSQAEVIFKLNASIIKYYFNNSNFQRQFGGIKDPKKYKDLLDEFFNQVKDTDDNGNRIAGTQCWRVGGAGSMGKHTSAAAKKNIFMTLDISLKAAIKNLYQIKL